MCRQEQPDWSPTTLEGNAVVSPPSPESRITDYPPPYRVLVNHGSEPCRRDSPFLSWFARFSSSSLVSCPYARPPRPTRTEDVSNFPQQGAYPPSRAQNTSAVFSTHMFSMHWIPAGWIRCVHDRAMGSYSSESTPRTKVEGYQSSRVPKWWSFLEATFEHISTTSVSKRSQPHL